MVSAPRSDFAADAIERQVGHLQLLGRGLAAPQQRPHARQQLDEGERLHQVIVGALFEAFDAVVERAARAQNQDRRAGLAVADLLQHLQAVHIGQHEVENHQVVIGGVDVVERGGAVGRGIHGVSRALEAAAEEVGDALFILDDQDSHCVLSLPNRPSRAGTGLLPRAVFSAPRLLLLDDRRGFRFRGPGKNLRAQFGVQPCGE